MTTPTDASGARCDCPAFTDCCEHTHAVVAACHPRLFGLAQELARGLDREQAGPVDEELHVYPRTITVEFSARWPIDQDDLDDLDDAVRLALEALALRVEGQETLELFVCEVGVRAITRP